MNQRTLFSRRALRPFVFFSLLGVLLLPLGCAKLRAIVFETFPSQGEAYSATATAIINKILPPAQARRDAITKAENDARDKLMMQASQLRLSDGRTLEDVAVVDPFIRAALLDIVRDAQTKDRTVNNEGLVTVTLRLDLVPVQNLISKYNLMATPAKPATPAPAK